MSAAPDLAFDIKGLRWVLSEDFTLEIDALGLPRGQTTLLLGPSASGKSTLLSLLGRVEGSYFPDANPRALSGEILLSVGGNGEGPLDLLSLGERELLKQRIRGVKVGFVFQREGLFAGRSVLENVAWPLQCHGMKRDAAESRARELLDLVALPESRDVATLSGGERKRLALARTLGPKPPVLLLDEPFTGLDPNALKALGDVLVRIADDPEVTIVMVTHQREDIERMGEFVVLMRRGSVARAGAREDLAQDLERFLDGEWLQDGEDT